MHPLLVLVAVLIGGSQLGVLGSADRQSR